MSEIDAIETADGSDSLLRALSQTPNTRPFDGTGRYRVRRCIGDGGFGVVYEVDDLKLGRRMALKTLKQCSGSDAANIRRIKSEFRSVSDLVHPNLVGLHELSSEDGRWFFTMDLVEGGDFLEYVCGQTEAAYARTIDGQTDAGNLLRKTSGILSETRLRAVLRQLVDGVSALHAAGIIHRDLKPNNVLVDADGRVVILDFGLAGSGQLTATDDSVSGAGTPLYMAPEQAKGGMLTPAADWYAVGVMLYEALTGMLPYDEQSALAMIHAKWTRDATPPSERCKVPKDLDALCVALLARDPNERPDADAILALLGDAPHANAAQTASTALFVGRSPEISSLRDAFRAVRAGQPRLVCIHGQPGVGKSALIEQFLRTLAAEERPAVLAAKCHERELVPFKSFDGVVDALQRYLQRLPRHEASALMPRDIHLVTQLFPVLDGVAATRDVPRPQGDSPEPRQARLRAFTAIRELLARIADKQPLVVVIDDLQWGDVDSARLLAHLMSEPQPPAMLLLLVYRADEVERSAPLGETLRMLHEVHGASPQIDVQPLSPNDSRELAAALVGNSEGSAEAIRMVAERGEGHPLFMTALARDVALRAPDGRSQFSLIDILWQRILRLPDAARALLETVAFAGQPRPSALCFAAAGLPSSALDEVRSLRAEQLLRVGDGGSLTVFHDRIRDAVMARADVATCRMRHLALARTLECETKCDLEALARHFEAAEEYPRAAMYAERAGDAAAAALAFDRAATMYRLAIERSPDAPAGVFRRLADALVNDGREVDAGAAYLEAATRSQGPEAIDLTRLAAEHTLMLGAADIGFSALNSALAGVGESLPNTPNAAKMEMIYRMLRIRFGRFRLRQPAAAIPAELLLRLDVLDTAARALDYVDMSRAGAMSARFCHLALRTGDPRRGALALIDSVVALIPGQKTRPAVADAVLSRAEVIGRELGDDGVLVRAASMRGKTYAAYGQWSTAADHFGQAAALAQRCLGVAALGRSSMAIGGMCRLRTGRLDLARSIGEAMLIDAEQRSDLVAAKAVQAAIMAPLAVADGDPQLARDVLRRTELEDRCTSVIFKAESTAAIANYEEDPQGAVAAWHCRMPAIEEYGVLTIPAFRVIMVRSLATSLLSGASTNRDVRQAKRLARSITGWLFPHAKAAHATIQACLALREENAAAAATFLERAVLAYDQADMALDALACRHRLAELRDDAASLREADDTLRTFGIAHPARWTKTIVPSMPPRRRLMLAAH